MQIEIPDDHLISVCGGNAGTGTAVDLGQIVKGHLYGRPELITERKIALGVVLVNALLRHINSNQ